MEDVEWDDQGCSRLVCGGCHVDQGCSRLVHVCGGGEWVDQGCSRYVYEEIVEFRVCSRTGLFLCDFTVYFSFEKWHNETVAQKKGKITNILSICTWISCSLFENI